MRRRESVPIKLTSTHQFAVCTNTISDSGPWRLRDTITEFTQGSDHIDVSLIDADPLGPVNDFTFIDTAAFGATPGGLRYFQTANATIIEGDTDGNGVANFSIKLLGLINLQLGDFVL